ncbi:MAG: methyltransferase domain-containing protein [Acidobacteriota bacterium]
MRPALLYSGIVLTLIGLGIPAATAFQAAAAKQAPASDRHPITGRRYAGVMGMAGAEWLVRPERETEEQPDLALDLMNIKPGMQIADIGSGVGYMTLRMAKRVGPSGKIYGVDLQQGMLDKLNANARAANISNVETILGLPADPKLPDGKMDIVLMVDVYHEVSQPQEMLRKLRQAMKPDGRLILLEYRAEDPAIPINPEHKMTIEQVRREIEPEGFKLQMPVNEALPRQHLLILTKTK